MTATSTATIKVTTVSDRRGDLEVHAPGCADLKRKANHYQDAFTWTVGSAVELSHEFWADQIGDQVDPNSPEGWAMAEEWVGTFRFLPCAPAFPGEAKPAKQTRAERIAANAAAEAARCAAASTPAVEGPHAFTAKGSAKASACVHCGRTWNAAAHRAYRLSVADGIAQA